MSEPVCGEVVVVEVVVPAVELGLLLCMLYPVHFFSILKTKPRLMKFLICLALVTTLENVVCMLMMMFLINVFRGSSWRSPLPERPFDAASEAANASTYIHHNHHNNKYFLTRSIDLEISHTESHRFQKHEG